MKRNVFINRRVPWLFMLLVVFLSACASKVPDIIRSSPAEDISLARVQSHPDRHIGKHIRWGGTIIAVDNQKAVTEITILAKPLDSSGEPLSGDRSYGRFIAQTKGFLDPAVYANGRAITVYGKLEKVSPRNINQYLYHYPVVQILNMYLWEELEKVAPYGYPYWYDPWYPYAGPYYHPHRHY